MKRFVVRNTISAESRNTPALNRRRLPAAAKPSRELLWTMVETTVIPVDGCQPYGVPALYGEVLFIAVTAERTASIFVSDEEDFEDWQKEFRDDEVLDPPNYFSREGVLIDNFSFPAFEDGTLIVTVVNDAEEPAKARIELTMWGKEDEPLLSSPSGA